MTSLTVEKLDHLKGLLDQRERILRDEIRREVSLQDNFSDLASEVADPGDSSFAHLAIDLGNAAVTRDLKELRAIQAARARMEQDTYGKCVECGYDIPYERMEALPTAERCAPCQEVYEKTHVDTLKGASL
jgi:DnaK suppressor protein